MAESVSSKNQGSDSSSVDSDIPLAAAHEYRSSVMASSTSQSHQQQDQDQEQQQQQQHAPPHSHVPLYHHYPPPPPPPSGYGSTGPYSAAVGNQSRSGPYPPPPPPHIASQHNLHFQGFQVQLHVPNGPNTSGQLPTSHHHEYHRPIPLRAHETEYIVSHHPPTANTYSSPIGVSIYGPPPDDRRWIGSEGQPQQMYSGYDGHRYNKALSSQSFPPPPPPSQHSSHLPYGYPQNVYPPATTNNRLEEHSRIDNHEPGPAAAEIPTTEVEGHRDHGATSPSQISSAHRDEVSNMGCTCKKTKCLKLYCQCFAVKVRN
jgi:Tesmin/TSO1-like CXC domain, cysteine-rich domain